MGDCDKRTDTLCRLLLSGTPLCRVNLVNPAPLTYARSHAIMATPI